MAQVTGADTTATRARRHRILRIGAGLWLAAVAGTAGVEVHNQESARKGLRDRFADRTRANAQFLETYTATLFRQQRGYAERVLDDAPPQAEEFNRMAEFLGYSSAVVLDGQGRALQIRPPEPELIGGDLTLTYDHLRRALAGENAISTVVPSAASGEPIVAFAVPFDTPSGRRVFSGGLDLSQSPVGAFLKSAIPIKPNGSYLLDTNSAVVAGTETPGTRVRGFGGHESALVAAVSERPAGRLRVNGTNWRFASAPVSGTPWRLVATVPEERLYAPVNGGPQATAWLFLAAVAVGGIVIVILALRLSDAAAARHRSVAEIAARGQVEAELAAARDHAIEASRLKSQFLSNTSHEIRTPLTVVLGMNELVLDTALDEDQRRLIESAQRAGTRLLALVDDLLELSQTGPQIDEGEVFEFDLRSLLGEVATVVAEGAETKGLQFASECGAEVPDMVRGNPHALRQVLFHLASNAVKFSDSGTVMVRATRPQGADQNVVRFEVTDTGLGIAPADRRHLFEPFAQVDGSSTRRQGGAGLGLALCAQLADAMGSTIVVESFPGQGSTFRFDVRFELDPAGETARGAGAGAAPSRAVPH